MNYKISIDSAQIIIKLDQRVRAARVLLWIPEYTHKNVWRSKICANDNSFRNKSLYNQFRPHIPIMRMLFYGTKHPQ